jgi:hypothetical protein
MPTLIVDTMMLGLIDCIRSMLGRRQVHLCVHVAVRRGAATTPKHAEVPILCFLPQRRQRVVQLVTKRRRNPNVVLEHKQLFHAKTLDA